VHTLEEVNRGSVQWKYEEGRPVQEGRARRVTVLHHSSGPGDPCSRAQRPRRVG